MKIHIIWNDHVKCVSFIKNIVVGFRVCESSLKIIRFYSNKYLKKLAENIGDFSQICL